MVGQHAPEFTGWELKYASDTLKDDKDLVLAAVTENGGALKFASNRLKNDNDVDLAAGGH